MSEASRKRSNSTCRLLGHDWMTGAAANWRVCRREQCPASERLVDGQWVSNAPLYRSLLPARRAVTRQPSIWNAQAETDQKKGTPQP